MWVPGTEPGAFRRLLLTARLSITLLTYKLTYHFVKKKYKYVFCVPGDQSQGPLHIN